jgi:hypothetical protein
VSVHRGSLNSRHDLAVAPGFAPGQAELLFPVRPRCPLDEPVASSAAALGLGPPPPPASDRLALRLGLGVIGTLATLFWMWSLAPPPPL